VGGYSAHAGQSDLVRFVTGVEVPPSEIRIVHGDADAKELLRRQFHSVGLTEIMIPGLHTH
jgi:metallo-beta-lactamase family protein